MKLNNIRLLVTHFDETFLFYKDILGLKVTWGNVGENYAQFQTSDMRDISLFRKNLMAATVQTSHLPAHTQAQDNIALIFSVDDLDNFYQTLTNKNVKFINAPTDQPDWGVRVAHLRDPEGNLIEFMTALSKEKFSDELKKEFDKYA